ncbi:hypothetical protein Efla_002929 [Eimeria flavescens]
MRTSSGKRKKRKGRLTPEEAEKLLEEHCRGMWTDSDDGAPQATDKRSAHSHPAEPAAPVDSGKSHENTAQCSAQEGAERVRAKRKGNPANEKTCIASRARHLSVEQPPVKEQYGASRKGAEDGCENGLEQQGEWKHKKTSKRQAKGLRRWSSMQARSASSSTGKGAASSEAAPHIVADLQAARRSSSKSFDLLRKLGGLCCSSGSGGEVDATSLEEFTRLNAKAADPRRIEGDSQKVFDETVHEIRHLVYPHLDRFQRRQFVTTALRALGIASTKTQKMPLPEYISRKKATAAALKARQAEAKLLGVSSHIDSQGCVQQAARSRAKLAAQKQRRRHLRDTFKHAGKYTGKRK